MIGLSFSKFQTNNFTDATSIFFSGLMVQCQFNKNVNNKSLAVGCCRYCRCRWWLWKNGISQMCMRLVYRWNNLPLVATSMHYVCNSDLQCLNTSALQHISNFQQNQVPRSNTRSLTQSATCTRDTSFKSKFKKVRVLLSIKLQNCQSTDEYQNVCLTKSVIVSWSSEASSVTVCPTSLFHVLSSLLRLLLTRFFK